MALEGRSPFVGAFLLIPVLVGLGVLVWLVMGTPLFGTEAGLAVDRDDDTRDLRVQLQGGGPYEWDEVRLEVVRIEGGGEGATAEFGPPNWDTTGPEEPLELRYADGAVPGQDDPTFDDGETVHVSRADGVTGGPMDDSTSFVVRLVDAETGEVLGEESYQDDPVWGS